MEKKEFEEYHAPVLYEEFTSEKDVYVTMRDGAKICIDIYKPVGAGPLPVLLSMGIHNKDLLDADYAKATPPQPAWSHFWFGNIECGDTKFFCSRGYVHVIAQGRGAGKSDTAVAWDSNQDHYDLIEWIAAQEWCDGNVGMFGLSNFGANQIMAAAQQPPHLKAIFPFDPGWCYGVFREMHIGGVLSTLMYHLDAMSVNHMKRAQPPKLPDEVEALFQEALKNPDYQMYKNYYNMMTMRCQGRELEMMHMINPYDAPDSYEAGVNTANRIQIPVYTGAGQYGIDYKFHWQGAQSWFKELGHVPRKLLLTGPAVWERPVHSKTLVNEAMKWYDYWLKGIDTGIMDEPTVRYWVTGENKWRYADNWPIPETQWTPLYFNSWERLEKEPMDPYSIDETNLPDAFVQMQPTLTNKIEKVRYMTEPLADDVTIAGPIAAKFWASLDSEDTNWIVTLKDLGPDTSDRTGRKGEREIPDLPEKYLTKGLLKASLRELDENLSTPYKPWPKLTRESRKMVVPGEINEYNVEIMSVCHTFKAGHRICVEISCLDLPDGPNCAADTEYIPYHICRNATVLHKIYRDAAHPSHILLPVIPD